MNLLCTPGRSIWRRVDAGPGMFEPPGDNGEDAGPLFDQFEGAQGAFGQPGEQRGLLVAGERDHGGELPGFLPLANPAQSVVQ